MNKEYTFKVNYSDGDASNVTVCEPSEQDAIQRMENSLKVNEVEFDSFFLVAVEADGSDFK